MSSSSAMINQKAISKKFIVLEPLFWCIFATFGNYISALSLSRGYSQSITSIMVAAYMSFAFIGQFAWGSICDRFRTNKKVFMLGITSAALLYIAIYFSASPILFVIFYACLGFMLGPMGSIMDSWLLKSTNFDSSTYGHGRASGALGYAVIVMIMGLAIKHFGYGIMPGCSLFVILVGLLLASTIPDAPVLENTEKEITLKDIGMLKKIGPFIIMLVILFLIGMSVSPVNSLKIMFLKNVGGDVQYQGIDAFFGNIVQFLLFMSAGKLKKISPQIRLFIATLIPILMVLITFFANRPYMIIIGTMLFNVSYAIMLPTTREIVAQKVDFSLQTTANGISDAVYGSLTSMFSLLYAGYIMDTLGVKPLLAFSLLLLVCAATVMVIYLFIDKKQKKGIPPYNQFIKL